MSGTTTYSPTLYGCSEPSGRLPTGPLNIKQNWQDLLRYACARARTGMPVPSKVIQKIRTGPVDGVTEAHYPRYSRGIAYQPLHGIKLENKKPIWIGFQPLPEAREPLSEGHHQQCFCGGGRSPCGAWLTKHCHHYASALLRWPVVGLWFGLDFNP
jgi:hypothetical protein